MGRWNFFRNLAYIERAVEGNEPNIQEEYSVETRSAIQRLIAYVEQGSFLGSEAQASRFICKYWRCSIREMQEEWHKITGKNKSASAFSAQISNMSKELYTLFPEEEAFGEVLLEMKADYISRTLDALAYDNQSFATLFPTLTKYVEYSDFKNYKVEELEPILKMLRVLCAIKGRLEGMDNTDASKLGFIKLCLDDRIICNPDKIEVLKGIGLVK